MTDGVTLGISGWFTPRGTLYHEEGRTVAEIADHDWAVLLAHADAIGFFTRPDPPLPAHDARIFHLTIMAGERSRELAVNDPFEAPELALLIRLTRRAMRDRIAPEDRHAGRAADRCLARPSVARAKALIRFDRRCAGGLCGSLTTLQHDDRPRVETEQRKSLGYVHPMRRPRM